MIFLAISGLLLLIAIIGSGEMAKRTRFTSTVDGAHSVIQRLYDEIVNGVNTRSITDVVCNGSVAPGTDRCLLIGRVIIIDSSQTLTSYYVTATAPTTGTNAYERLKAVRDSIRVWDTNSIHEQLQWGATIRGFSRDTARGAGESISDNGNPQRTRINAVAFLRDPAGAQIVNYFFYSSDTTASGLQTLLRMPSGPIESSLAVNTGASLCIVNEEDWTAASSPIAAVVFHPGVGASTIDTNYQPSTGSSGVC